MEGGIIIIVDAKLTYPAVQSSAGYFPCLSNPIGITALLVNRWETGINLQTSCRCVGIIPAFQSVLPETFPTSLASENKSTKLEEPLNFILCMVPYDEHTGNLGKRNKSIPYQ